jgi:hypothetical protein
MATATRSAVATPIATIFTTNENHGGQMGFIRKALGFPPLAG